jgi:hypothetical protein
LPPPTVGLAKGAVAAALEYVQKNKLSDQDREAILEKAQELESALNDMSPVQGRNHISWYEAPSPEANTQYQELMNFLGKKISP